MVEARKCVRCGAMYISDTEVCGNCQKKDGAEIYRLKGFFENEIQAENLTQGEIAIATGITNKNLSRFLGHEEFKDIYNGNGIPASGDVNGQGDVIEELI